MLLLIEDDAFFDAFSEEVSTGISSCLIALEITLLVELACIFNEGWIQEDDGPKVRKHIVLKVGPE